ncbi:MAG: 2Fe-2S iron-sulfur cluster-binding protein [Gammaproteobacteria bacterium]|nr:2Fe-2S iron-sulfur cluster-binding protein [Gammaproteobacteria bacterium]
MPRITFVHFDGARETHGAHVGDTVMDCALDNSVRGIKAQCGGGCTCSTCHCYVESPWFEQLPPPISDEQDMLEFVWERRDNSRLSCQVFVDDDLDGIVVHIPEMQA